MDEKPISVDSALYEEEEHNSNNNNYGWQKVTYVKRQRKNSAKNSDAGSDLAKFRMNGSAGGDKSNPFQSIEQKSEERRRAIEAQKAAAAASATAAVPRSKHHSDDDGDDSDFEASGAVENGTAEVKKPKQKKPKAPKITVADAASKIDASHLNAYLIDATVSYESQPEIQLMRFADYFGRAFAGVSAAQFPWTKLFKESPVAKIVDIPLSHISEAVYKTSTDWINQRPSDALGVFVLWSLDSILADLAIHQGPAKGSKKVAHQVPSKAQVAIFVVLAILLRRKPDILINVLPTLRENPKYQGQDKVPVMIWLFAQASQGDLVVGMYSWVHNLLPMVTGKSCNPQSRDLILQLAERILSMPKARPMLLNGVARKGERLVPPSALEQLMRVTFPVPSARIKATERFEAIYPTLKELALSGVSGSKAMKQVSLQTLNFAIQAVGESIPDLSKEATGIFIWCLTENPDCCKQWDKIYLDHIDASVKVLKKLSDDWKLLSIKHTSLEPLKETLKSFRQKNEKALDGGDDAHSQASINEADKYCKVLLGRVSRGHGCMKSMVFAAIALAIGAFVMSPDMESWDLKKFSVMFSSQQSF